MPLKVTLYTRFGCHLCDDAKRVILEAQRRAGFEYEELDIDRDPELRKLYHEEVPVVAINGVKTFIYGVELETLLKRLSAIMI